MAGTAPDATAKFDLDSPCADDAAVRNLLLSATGQELRVGSEHWLGKCASRTRLFKSKSASEVRLGWESVNFVFLHVVDITALSGIKAGWLFRPAFLSQVLMDLLTAGGLQAVDAAHESDLVVALAAAAKTAPPIRAAVGDVVLLETLRTGTWLDDALTGPFISRDGKGRALAQMRSTFGGWLTAAEALAVKPLLVQAPYTLQTVVGDIQGLDPTGQAQLIGAAFVQTELAARQELSALPERPTDPCARLPPRCSRRSRKARPPSPGWCGRTCGNHHDSACASSERIMTAQNAS